MLELLLAGWWAGTTALGRDLGEDPRGLRPPPLAQSTQAFPRQRAPPVCTMAQTSRPGVYPLVPETHTPTHAKPAHAPNQSNPGILS